MKGPRRDVMVPVGDTLLAHAGPLRVVRDGTLVLCYRWFGGEQSC